MEDSVQVKTDRWLGWRVALIWVWRWRFYWLIPSLLQQLVTSTVLGSLFMLSNVGMYLYVTPKPIHLQLMDPFFPGLPISLLFIQFCAKVILENTAAHCSSLANYSVSGKGKNAHCFSSAVQFLSWLGRMPAFTAKRFIHFCSLSFLVANIYSKENSSALSLFQYYLWKYLYLSLFTC